MLTCHTIAFSVVFSIIFQLCFRWNAWPPHTAIPGGAISHHLQRCLPFTICTTALWRTASQTSTAAERTAIQTIKWQYYNFSVISYTSLFVFLFLETSRPTTFFGQRALEWHPKSQEFRAKSPHARFSSHGARAIMANTSCGQEEASWSVVIARHESHPTVVFLFLYFMSAPVSLMSHWWCQCARHSSRHLHASHFGLHFLQVTWMPSLTLPCIAFCAVCETVLSFGKNTRVLSDQLVCACFIHNVHGIHFCSSGVHWWIVWLENTLIWSRSA